MCLALKSKVKWHSLSDLVRNWWSLTSQNSSNDTLLLTIWEESTFDIVEKVIVTEYQIDSIGISWRCARCFTRISDIPDRVHINAWLFIIMVSYLQMDWKWPKLTNRIKTLHNSTSVTYSLRKRIHEINVDGFF